MWASVTTGSAVMEVISCDYGEITAISVSAEIRAEVNCLHISLPYLVSRERRNLRCESRKKYFGHKILVKSAGVQ
jgi:hypothetical protein